MARPSPPDGFAGAPSSWAPLSTEAAPAGERAAGADTAQMPLSPAPVAPAPAPTRPARLRGRLLTLLAHSPAVAATPEPSGPAPSWPDSFFDAER